MKTYSTGDIAKLCDVNLRTVIRWIEKGELEGFKLPGRGNNRVTHAALLRFLKVHKIPLAEALIAGEKSRALVVDDEADVAKSISRVLKSEGFDTYISTDGFQAGIQYAELRPELITIDLSMPEVDCMSIIEGVRKRSKVKDTRILVIFGCGAHRLSAAVKAKADAVLEKPFTSDELLIALRRLGVTSPVS